MAGSPALHALDLQIGGRLMPLWVKVAVDITRHPKFIAARRIATDAGWLWLGGLGYCRGIESDGVIPADLVPTLVPGIKRPAACAEALVTAGLWVVCPAGYQMHDYLQWNPSRQQIEAKRQEDRARKRGSPPSGFRTESERNPNGIQTESTRSLTRAGGRGSTLSALSGEIGNTGESARGGPPAPSPGPLIDGRMQRRHGTHAKCFFDRGLCVTPWVWDELVGKIGGPAETRVDRLRAWMDAEVAALGDAPVGDEPDAWWRKRFAAWVGVEARPQPVHEGRGARGARAFREAGARLRGER